MRDLPVYSATGSLSVCLLDAAASVLASGVSEDVEFSRLTALETFLSLPLSPAGKLSLTLKKADVVVNPAVDQPVHRPGPFLLRSFPRLEASRHSLFTEIIEKPLMPENDNPWKIEVRVTKALSIPAPKGGNPILRIKYKGGFKAVQHLFLTFSSFFTFPPHPRSPRSNCFSSTRTLALRSVRIEIPAM